MRESTRRGHVLVNVSELTGIFSITQIRVNSGVVDRSVGGARRICSVHEFLRQLTREFFSSFELLNLSSRAVSTVVVETSEEA
ncbi:hypothetical protein F511_20230 [Dorcoceras hygrometricum]|uniref:Uncharacterized protein n=1 Tax=Dorcoceras hygrometricum TaxID=472368 RepID=A0A2Z7AT91_9LAMI|nr:hypothetical protein F511_20230 [Dorcoceras hygrometricum]